MRRCLSPAKTTVLPSDRKIRRAPKLLPSRIRSAGGTTITVAHRGEAYDDWIIGDDEKEGTFVAVAECNANVDGALNVVTEFVPGSSSASEFIRNEAMLVESGTDAHDVIVPDQYYGTAFAANSTYANLLDEEHSGYFQFGEEWWYNDYMSNLTMGDDIQSFAVGFLGRGGMAEVYEVEDVGLDSRYALKLFTYARGEEASARARFFAEGRLLAQLDHPRLVLLHVRQLEALQ